MNPAFLALTLSILGFSQIHAQNLAKIKPLEAELATCTDTARLIEINRELLHEYEVFDINKSIQYGTNLWELGVANSNKKVMTDASYILGGIYHFDANDASKALEWQMKSLDLSRQIKDSVRITDAAYRLAMLNSANGDTERATFYYKFASDIATLHNDFTMVTMANIGLGEILKNNNEKYKHYSNALQAAEQNSKDTTSLVQALVAMGDYSWDVGKKKDAQAWYERIYKKVAPCFSTTKDLFLVEMYAHACLRTDRYDECIQAANLLANSIPFSGGSSWYIETGMKLLAQAYYKNGYDSLAFWTAMNYVDLRDSLNQKRFSDRAQNKVLTVQAEFELQRKAQELALLRAKNHYEMLMAYTLSFIVILLCGIIYYLYRMRQRENQQNRKLAQLNQTKDKLLSIISHDVRSPVQALQNIISLFEQDIATKEDVQMVTKQVNASIQAMAQGLDNLFYWAQNQQQELKAYPELFNLSTLVRDQIEQHAPNITKKGITLECTLVPDITICADVLHTRLIFNNVLSNAIKFAAMNGHIKIEFTALNDKEGLLSVFNSGEPINENDILKILNSSIRYTRPGTCGEPGSGLGLSLTRDLLVLNNGTIQIQGVQGKGTQIELGFRLEKW